MKESNMYSKVYELQGRALMGQGQVEKGLDVLKQAIGKKDKSGKHPPCGSSGKKRGYAKCVPASKAAGMSKKQKARATRRKRAAQNKAGRGGTSSLKGGGKKPIRVSTKPKK